VVVDIVILTFHRRETTPASNSMPTEPETPNRLVP